MILGRLLGALFKNGVVFVMTSNYHPDDLYPNGLQRQNLLPTIALLKEWLDVIEIDGGTDYRLRELEQLSCYYVAPAGAADAQRFPRVDRLRAGPGENPPPTPRARGPKAERRAGGGGWVG